MARGSGLQAERVDGLDRHPGCQRSGCHTTVNDNAYGFEEALLTADAVRESTWKTALELLGLFSQYSTDGSTASDDPSDDDTHYRLATGTEKPDDDSDRWSAWIPLGGDSLDTDGVDERIATWARANNPTGTIPDARIAADIMRDAEFTAAAVRTLLSLSQLQRSMTS